MSFSRPLNLLFVVVAVVLVLSAAAATATARGVRGGPLLNGAGTISRGALPTAGLRGLHRRLGKQRPGNGGYYPPPEDEYYYESEEASKSAKEDTIAEGEDLVEVEQNEDDEYYYEEEGGGEEEYDSEVAANAEDDYDWEEYAEDERERCSTPKHRNHRHCREFNEQLRTEDNYDDEEERQDEGSYEEVGEVVEEQEAEQGSEETYVEQEGNEYEDLTAVPTRSPSSPAPTPAPSVNAVEDFVEAEENDTVEVEVDIVEEVKDEDKEQEEAQEGKGRDKNDEKEEEKEAEEEKPAIEDVEDRNSDNNAGGVVDITGGGDEGDENINDGTLGTSTTNEDEDQAQIVSVSLKDFVVTAVYTGADGDTDEDALSPESYAPYSLRQYLINGLLDGFRETYSNSQAVTLDVEPLSIGRRRLASNVDGEYQVSGGMLYLQASSSPPVSDVHALQDHILLEMVENPVPSSTTTITAYSMGQAAGNEGDSSKEDPVDNAAPAGDIDNMGSSSSHTGGAAVAGVVITIAAVFVILGAALYVRRRYRNSSASSVNDEDESRANVRNNDSLKKNDTEPAICDIETESLDGGVVRVMSLPSFDDGDESAGGGNVGPTDNNNKDNPDTVNFNKLAQQDEEHGDSPLLIKGERQMRSMDLTSILPGQEEKKAHRQQGKVTTYYSLDLIKFEADRAQDDEISVASSVTSPMPSQPLSKYMTPIIQTTLSQEEYLSDSEPQQVFTAGSTTANRQYLNDNNEAKLLGMNKTVHSDDDDSAFLTNNNSMSHKNKSPTSCVGFPKKDGNTKDLDNPLSLRELARDHAESPFDETHEDDDATLEKFAFELEQVREKVCSSSPTNENSSSTTSPTGNGRKKGCFDCNTCCPGQ